jgi:LDH2 family malate/lactate/ureidoglycolate dehydrogenase
MAETATVDDRLANERALVRFVAGALRALGVEAPDAAVVADVLVAADLRGIASHGVARLVSHDVRRLRDGLMAAQPTVTVVRETPTSIVLDAGNGLGPPAAKRAMDRVIEKARDAGTAFGAVRNSNHFGIAGFYAMLALEHDMIGIASTNAMRSAAPTFGREILLGTNPLAFAIPAQHEPPFVLDFATTTERGGALAPLGGFGIEGGGHKGYGLGVLVDILCGVLSGGAFGAQLPGPNDAPQSGKISHFFGAIRLDGFRDAARFKADMDTELRTFKESRKSAGHDRVYVAGEIEYEKALFNRTHGVPVNAKVWAGLEELAGELGIPFDLA